MIKYLIVGGVASVLSLLLEILVNGGVRKKIQGKRLLILWLSALIVWLSCLYFNAEHLLSVFFAGIAFELLLAIAVSDHDTKQIPNGYLIALLLAAIVYTVCDPVCPWYWHLLGGGFGYGVMFLIRAIGNKVAKQETLGIGDVYVSGILGLLLGIGNYMLCGWTACLVALIVIQIVRRKKQYDKMHRYPFSPFFAVGYAVAAVLGNTLWNLYTAWIAAGGLFG